MTRIARNVAFLGVGQVLSWLATLGLTVLLPRYLGDANLGRFALAQSFTGLFGVFLSLGTSTYLAKEVARSSATAKEPALNALAMRLPLGIIGGAAVVLAAFWLDYDHTTRLLIIVFWVNTVLLNLYGLLAGVLQGLQDMRPAALLMGFMSLVACLITGVLGYFGQGAVLIAISWNFTMGAVVIGLLLVVWRKNGMRGRLSMGLWPQLVRFGLPFLVWDISLFIYGRIDVLLLSFFTDEEVIGWYSAAYRLASLPMFLPSILLSAVFPAMAVAAKNDLQQFRKLSNASLRIIVFITFPITAAIIVAADSLIHFLGYSESFEPSIILLRIVSVHIPLVAIDMVIASCLNALDRQKSWALVGVAAAFFNPALNLLLIPVSQDLYGNGAIGAAVATVTTEVFMTVCGIYLLKSDALSTSNISLTVRVSMASLLMAFTLWLARDAFLPIGLALGGLTYLAASVWLKSLALGEIKAAVAAMRSRRGPALMPAEEVAGVD